MSFVGSGRHSCRVGLVVLCPSLAAHPLTPRPSACPSSLATLVLCHLVDRLPSLHLARRASHRRAASLPAVVSVLPTRPSTHSAALDSVPSPPTPSLPSIMAAPSPSADSTREWLSACRADLLTRRRVTTQALTRRSMTSPAQSTSTRSTPSRRPRSRRAQRSSSATRTASCRATARSASSCALTS